MKASTKIRTDAPEKAIVHEAQPWSGKIPRSKRLLLEGRAPSLETKARERVKQWLHGR